MKPKYAPHVIELIKSQKRRLVLERDRLKFIQKHAAKLSGLPSVDLYGCQLDFNRLTHPDTIKVIRAFGGKWDKQLTDGESARVDYTRTIDGIIVRIWNGEPPPNCKIVETVQLVPEVPASTRVVRRLVCK
jgi:hypothetical protein